MTSITSLNTDQLGLLLKVFECLITMKTTTIKDRLKLAWDAWIDNLFIQVGAANKKSNKSENTISLPVVIGVFKNSIRGSRSDEEISAI